APNLAFDPQPAFNKAGLGSAFAAATEEIQWPSRSPRRSSYAAISADGKYMAYAVEAVALLLRSNRKQTLRRPHVHHALRQGRRGHQQLPHRIGCDVRVFPARRDDQHLTVFVRKIKLAVGGDRRGAE